MTTSRTIVRVRYKSMSPLVRSGPYFSHIRSAVVSGKAPLVETQNVWVGAGARSSSFIKFYRLVK